MTQSNKAAQPVLIDLPDRLETARLILRPPRPGDGPGFNTAARGAWAECKPWMPWAANPVPSVDEHEALMRHAHAAWIKREGLWILLTLKSSGQIIGSSGFHECNWHVPCFEIGYWIATSFAGQGYMTEAVNAQVAFAFEVLGARRLTLRADTRNAKSIAVAERCGFQLEGILRNDGREPDGTLSSTCLYAQVR